MAEDMDDELLLVTGRQSAAKKRRAADYDEELDEPVPGSTKRGKTAAAGDAEGDDDMDEAERQKLEAMNELEREMYLYEREEQLQRARLGKAVLAQTRDTGVEVRASSRRPRAQTGTDSAIGKIAAAHAQREAREKKKKKEEAERQEKQARARGHKRVTDDEAELPDEEEEGFSEEEESASEGEQASDDAGLSGLEEEEEEDDREAGAAAGKAGARAETYDEGAGYEEAEDAATLDEILSIQLTRQRLEQWHNEPFFEADLPGCLLRIVPNMGPNTQQRSQQPQYMLVRVEGVVQRNSYGFPKPPERTRKWLHLDDLTGTVFRHQMNMVSNSPITNEEYERAKAKAARAGAKFITKGDVQQALEKLQHAQSFKYDQALVKEMLQKKRAAGKMTGGYAQTRARLTHELILAQQEGRSDDDIQRIREELDRLEQQQRTRMEEEEELLAAAVEAEKAQAAMPQRVKPAMALALVNMRNRDKNAFKTINAAPGSAVAKAAAATLDGSNMGNDVFSRRHTVSKVYWATGRGKAAAAGTEDGAAGGQEQQRLRRSSSSGAAEVEGLKGSLKRMDPSELIKVLDLSVDLGALPRAQQDLVPKRVLGPRWYQTLEKRQQAIVMGRHLISLQEWRQRCEQTRAL